MKPAILVTGASTGIGRACAVALTDSFKVFGSVRKESDGVDLLAAGVTPVVMDVTNDESIAEGYKTIVQAMEPEQPFWGLVNNAGVVVAGPMEAMTRSDLQYQFDVNVFGQVMVTRAFLPLLRSSQGRIVMMSSNSGLFGAPFLGPYSSSKFAMEGFSDSWRRELQKWGIQVALVEPGAIATPIWDKSRDTNEDRQQHFAPEITLLYGEAMDQLRAVAARNASRASDAKVVVAAVRHALVAERAKPRYLVGANVYEPLIVQKLFPTHIGDKLVLYAMGMKKWLLGDTKPPL